MSYRRTTRSVWTPILLAALVVISGCAGQEVRNAPRTEPGIGPDTDRTAHRRPQPTKARRAASIAVKQVGVPYHYGGSDGRGFDCSGLVYYAYANAGKQVARTTNGLWNSLQPVSRKGLQVGDVLFFSIEGKMSHVGMYLGRGQFVHAPSSGRRVVVANLDSDFYRRAFIRGGRAR